MRSISTNGLAMLAQRLGNEPIMIVEVDWRDGVQPKQYADREVTLADGTVIPGAIVQISDLDDAIDVTTWNNSSKQIEVTLDDTDGSIKNLFDRYDITKRTVRVYQWFTGLDWSDRFVAFVGLINSPVSWNERDRTFKITVLSQIEDLECGFSAEEGNFSFIPADLVGKAWPQVFGLVYDYPALFLGAAVEGTLLQPIGFVSEFNANIALYGNGSNVDGKKLSQLATETQHAAFLSGVSMCWAFFDSQKAADYDAQAQKIYTAIGQQTAAIAHAEACAQQTRKQQYDRAHALLLGSGANPVQVLGGEDFPQNETITLNVKGATVTGYFKGEYFYIESADNPQADIELANKWYNEWLDYYLKKELTACTPMPTVQHTHYEAVVPCDATCCNDPFAVKCITSVDYTTVSSAPEQKPTPPYVLKQFWADPGTPVKLYTEVAYIASITPGTVLAVKAYRTYDGARQLVTLTPDMYKVSTVNYGSVTAVQINLPQLLSTVAYPDKNGDLIQGWSDELYITFQSTVGPNIVDILTYIIDYYTTLTCDATSFAYVKTKLAPFPANFPLLQRKNVVEVLKEICFQSRCAFWLEDNVVYLKYLPEVPTPVDTITVSDIDAEQGMEVEFTRMEDVVTKMNVKWYMTYAPGVEQLAAAQEALPQYMILRHNVAHYGLLEKDYDWYIFNQPDIILKMATFWLNRLSNTWKRVKFRTYLNHLNLEALDAVNFNAPGYVASGPVTVIVERAGYDSANNCINFECATPVKAGTVATDPFYWPAALPASVTWPPASDITTNNAGGGGPGINATGLLPVGLTEQWAQQLAEKNAGGSSTIFVGGPNVIFMGHSDWGDSTPTDVGFVAQSVVQPASFLAAQEAASPMPGPYLSQAAFGQYQLPDSDPMVVPADPVPEITIDLWKTRITDSKQGINSFDYLASVLSLQPYNGVPTLGIDGTKAVVRSTDKPDGALFDFKYDGAGGKMGAGTAFLQGGGGSSP